MNKIIFTLLIFMCSNTQAFTLKLGAAQFQSTHPVDNDKVGLALGMRFNEDKSHSLLLDAKIGFMTSDPVNPGAGNNPTAPDEEEEYNGRTPLLVHALYQIRTQPLVGKISFGTTIYALDLGGAYANNFSESFTYKQEWDFKPMSFLLFKIGGLISMSLTNTDQLPTLFAPEASLSILLGSLVEIEAKYESLNMLFLGDGPDGFTQDIISLNFIFPNRF